MQDFGSKLFVGRKEELQSLDECWTTATTAGTAAKRVYAVLNAPGVGKTALLEHFGNKLIAEKKGLMVEINVLNTNNTILEYYILVLKEIGLAIKKNRKMITKYFTNKVSEEFELVESVHREQYPFQDEEEATIALQDIEDYLNGFIKKFNQLKLSSHTDQELLAYISDEFPTIISDLSTIIPVFLFIDEIQVLQSLNHLNIDNEVETFLHVCSKELADLLPTKTLIVVSGTQYRLLKQIGYKLGSPLRNKVDPFIIHPLIHDDLVDYYNKVSKYFLDTCGNLKTLQDQNLLLKWYIRMIYGYSGGHARTLTKLTNRFLEKFIKNSKIPSSYSKFLTHFTDPHIVNRFYPELSGEVKEAFPKLQKNSKFKDVHNWIVGQSIFGANLYLRPDHQIKEADEEIDIIMNTLVQMGILMINGDENYYITSYFHYLAYLSYVVDDYTVFLNEILTNKYFKQMCGYHSGLGYVFEEIFLATLMMIPDSKTPKIANKIPFDLNKSYKVIKIPKSVNYTTLNVEIDTIYHTPSGAGVDFIIRDEDKIILIQVTTLQTVTLKKIQGMEEIFNALLRNNQNLNVLRWFISLTPIPENIFNKVKNNHNMLFTAAEELRDIIGQEMYDRINGVKEEFRNPT